VWEPVPAQPGEVTEPGLIVYRFGADLFYANQNRFTDEVRALVAKAPTPVHAVVIDASAITDIDCSAAQGLLDLIGEMKRRNVTLVFGRVTSYLKSDFDRHGITAAVGAGQIFTTLHAAIAYARGQALPHSG
jgi:MFS superfamily sulfate permease-like transporter